MVLKNDIIFSDKVKGGKNINAELSFGLRITGISNLKIVSDKDKLYTLIQPNPAYKVLAFYGCENIHIQNVKAGHEPKKGSCSASVISIDKSQNFFITDSDLYGSGYEGITAYEVTGLYVKNTKIHECSFSMMTLSLSENLYFMDCSFVDNNEPSGAGKFYFAKSENIIFENGEIARNARFIGQPTQDAMFELDDCGDIILNNLHIHDNSAGRFSTDDKMLKINNVKFENNTWDVKPTASK